MKFSPDGDTLASGSFDKNIYLWKVHSECENYMVLKGHGSAVLELHYSLDGSQVFSASADRTAAVWDLNTGMRVKKFSAHTSYVNSCSPNQKGPQLFATGSDDRSVKVWDVTTKEPVTSLEQGYPVTAVAFQDRDQLFAGGIDNDIKLWDLRKRSVVMTLSGHNDTVTGLSLSADGSYLLSNSMDQTVRIWDIRPFVQGHRNIKIFEGVQHNFEKNLLRCSWSADGTKISAGSADRFVYIWDTASRRILYKLPGHRGSVNETAFHPKEPIVGSASSDHTIYLGEVKP
jgi:Prp8 binding protein